MLSSEHIVWQSIWKLTCSFLNKCVIQSLKLPFVVVRKAACWRAVTKRLSALGCASCCHWNILKDLFITQLHHFLEIYRHCTIMLFLLRWAYPVQLLTKFRDSANLFFLTLMSIHYIVLNKILHLKYLCLILPLGIYVFWKKN